MSMLQTKSLQPRSTVPTSVGEIAYLEAGSGPAALFVHGVFFNAELWRGQLEGLAGARRCLAPDLLAHGQSAFPTAGLTIEDQAAALLAFLDALDVHDVDLVGNDTGGAVAQLLAATTSVVRSLVLTNCDTEGHLPPAAFQPIVDLARAGQLAGAVQALASDPAAARAAVAMGFEQPDALSDDYLCAMFSPFADPRRAKALEAYVAGLDDAPLVAAHDALAAFDAPTLVVWGTGDAFFEVGIGRALAAMITGAREIVELDGARLFFPLERAAALNREVLRFWSSIG